MTDGRHNDAERMGANSIMKWCIHDTDFTVSGHVNPWGSGLDPDLFHLEGIQLMAGHASHESP